VFWDSDGSSLVVSDEVGQIYIFGTGPEMSQKDVKYDQVGISALSSKVTYLLLDYIFLVFLEYLVGKDFLLQ
jgi:hypothetical protein